MDPGGRVFVFCCVEMGAVEHRVNPGAAWTRVRGQHLKVLMQHKIAARGRIVYKDSHKFAHRFPSPFPHMLLLPSGGQVHAPLLNLASLVLYFDQQNVAEGVFWTFDLRLLETLQVLLLLFWKLAAI